MPLTQRGIGDAKGGEGRCRPTLTACSPAPEAFTIALRTVWERRSPDRLFPPRHTRPIRRSTLPGWPFRMGAIREYTARAELPPHPLPWDDSVSFSSPSGLCLTKTLLPLIVLLVTAYTPQRPGLPSWYTARFSIDAPLPRSVWHGTFREKHGRFRAYSATGPHLRKRRQAG